MDKNKKKTESESLNQDIIDSYDYLTNAASSQDCTGLIPSEPEDDAEREAYEDVYRYLPPAAKK